MPFEIERKFLVASQSWRADVTRSIQIHDGLLATGPDSKVRIRISDDAATMTFKGPRVGVKRAEFEYPIPVADAEALLADHTLGPVLTKTRHLVPHGDHVWHVDVYDGLLLGVILAEVELTDEDEAFLCPAWLGREVTGDPRWSKIAMVKERLSRTNGTQDAQGA